MGYRASATIALLVGLVLIGSSFVFFPHDGQDGCSNTVERIDRSDITYRHESTTEYSQLSEDAKRAFEMARTSDDNDATVYGDRCPNELIYSDGVAYYAIEKNGTYYELETAIDAGGLFPIDPVLNGLLLVSGFGSLLLGIVTLYKGEDVKFRKLANPLDVLSVGLVLEIVLASVVVLLVLPIRVAIPLVPLVVAFLIAYRRYRSSGG